MNGLGFIHLELTSRCNKKCFCCGRRKLEREYPELCNWGDMDYGLIQEIANQVPKGIVVQLHNNGEPLLSPHLGDTLHLFNNNIRCFNTNGKLLLEKADEIIGNLETLTISVVQDDPEQEEQYETVRRFLERKGSKQPTLIYRLLGTINQEDRWTRLPGTIAKRILHNPMGSRNYTKPVTIPEIGICLDLLTHFAIDRFGNISLCVRFDPEGELRIGNIKEITLEEAWTSEKRRHYIGKHIEQKRSELPGCGRCEYWGVPRGE